MTTNNHGILSDIPRDKLPRHIAVIMDGNGRWAKARGLPRTEGHKAGEASLFDVIEGALELGIPYLSAYAFSTENWKRSPDEVRFLMGFNRDVIRRRRDDLNAIRGFGAGSAASAPSLGVLARMKPSGTRCSMRCLARSLRPPWASSWTRQASLRHR